ncbi:hypothetical protein BDK51DRAFT_53159 [Blyttiomyces helicus]|uniref:Hexosyltransferase n=1 Tax=Blyttiomyces helicus TaxID=388810 RepID=A0A4P9W9W7_9FUNG|nr:hypothetical protein BDK51DRAFT_53159 [Blyttiomyces helicus]|eukprot:RKO88283.1 hypothetical protein BDK51DRAFT_53159 [Blyttiomyces helicus]
MVSRASPTTPFERRLSALLYLLFLVYLLSLLMPTAPPTPPPPPPRTILGLPPHPPIPPEMSKEEAIRTFRWPSDNLPVLPVVRDCASTAANPVRLFVGILTTVGRHEQRAALRMLYRTYLGELRLCPGEVVDVFFVVGNATGVAEESLPFYKWYGEDNFVGEWFHHDNVAKNRADGGISMHDYQPSMPDGWISSPMTEHSLLVHRMKTVPPMMEVAQWWIERARKAKEGGKV